MAYRIRELREKKKLTQEQLAQMSGVSRTRDIRAILFKTFTQR